MFQVKSVKFISPVLYPVVYISVSHHKFASLHTVLATGLILAHVLMRL